MKPWRPVWRARVDIYKSSVANYGSSREQALQSPRDQLAQWPIGKAILGRQRENGNSVVGCFTLDTIAYHPLSIHVFVFGLLGVHLLRSSK